MHYVRPFDPWKSKLCTCPPKYSFNPYTGCAHACLYCYATYIPNFFRLRLKKNLFKYLEKDLEKLSPGTLISMSNSSDPYPPVERELGITRKCLELIKEYDLRVLIVTKSDLFVRDLDLISDMKAAISVTITGCDVLEPNAPSTERRIEAFRKILDAGIPAILRFDPIVPQLNEDKLWIIDKTDPDHVVSSTLKLKRDSFRRVTSKLPALKDLFSRLYLECGERVSGYMYLPKQMRIKMLEKVAKKCEELGISYGFCREGIDFKAPSCDGSHLIMK